MSSKRGGGAVCEFPIERIQEAIRRHWGFDSLRPLQETAIGAVLSGRDSLLVLPTGGGKSLCYQAPAVVRGDTTVVVSPLISLMKDQVDALRANGIAAEQLNSAMPPEELRDAVRNVRDGGVRLLFVSPERMATESFRNLLREIRVRAFAIDEAHCISHWGHDFRPEYRQLNHLKALFPDASLHAFTATATEQVRLDIVQQLGLHNPLVLVGNFDRPNLTYRIIPRDDLLAQTREVLNRHSGEAGIIYCIRRRDVDDMTANLKAQGINALPYHAGLSAEQRKRAQDAFADEKCDLIVATVAFGMGIDRSNIRFVLHTGMPKSIEGYQQETGRAGRDGLEAECVLLYSAADAMLWRNLVEKSASDSEAPSDPEYIRNSLKHIADMEGYCRPVACRHRGLVNYFGQEYAADSCQACDICLGDRDAHPEGQVLAQKILSCVARVKESFGVNHVIGVLRGENSASIRQRGHEQLSTYGLLAAHDKTEIRDWIHQLIGQDLLLQTGGEYPVLKLNPASWEVLKGQRSANLLARVETSSEGSSRETRKSKAAAVSWEGVDRDLFEELRGLRKRLAEERNVAPYAVFSDATLRELARVRPSTIVKMHMVYGVGEAKLRDFGEMFLALVDETCQRRSLSRDVAGAAPKPARAVSERSARSTETSQRMAQMFAAGAGIEEVMAATNRARGTVMEYLCEFIRENRVASVSQWVPDDLYRKIAAAAEEHGDERMKPIYVALGEKVGYDSIRVVLAHRATLAAAAK